MRKIRVCQVLNAYRVGGAETVALDVARSLDPDRFESLAVAVIEPRTTSEPEMRRRFREAGVQAHSLYHRSFRDPRTLWDLVRFFRRLQPDIVHGHNRFADYWACRSAGWAGVPQRIWTRHLVYRDMSPRQLARYRSLARSTPVVLAVSDAVRRHCLETEGLAPDRVRTVVNGIDTDRFGPAAASERAAVRAALGLTDTEKFLLFVGRLTRQKGPDLFVDLVQALRARGLPVRGFLCGDGDLAGSLATRDAAATGVSMLGLRSDIPALLAACDLFVSTSRNEGLPLNIMEAMAAGAAFVGPDLPQVVQLTHGEAELAGSLCGRPPAEGPWPRDLLHAWTDLTAARLTDDDLRRRCGERGRATICERFSLQRMVSEHEAIYTELAAGA